MNEETVIENIRLETGIIGDFLCGKFRLDELHKGAAGCCLRPRHFQREAFRKAFSVIVLNEAVPNADELMEIVKESVPDDCIEATVSCSAASLPSALDDMAKLAQNGRRRANEELGRKKAESGGDPFVCAEAIFEQKDLNRDEEAAAESMRRRQQPKKKNGIRLSEWREPTEEEEREDTLFEGGWLRKTQTCMLVSTSGAGKSSMSIQFVHAWALGRPMFGIAPTRPLKIGIFQSEDDRYALKKFFRSMRTGFARYYGWTDADIDEARKNIALLDDEGKRGGEFIELVREAQRTERAENGTPFDIIMINPLYKFVEGDLSKPEVVDQFMGQLDSVIKDPLLKSAAFIYHHTPKPPTQRGNPEFGTGNNAQYAGYGSSYLQNHVRAALTVIRKPSKEAVKRASREFWLTAAKGGDALDWPDDRKTIRHAPRESKLIFWLEDDSAAPETGETKSPEQQFEEDKRLLVEELKREPITRTAARNLARSKFGRKRGDAIYEKIMEHLCDNGLTEIAEGNKRLIVGK